MTRTFTNRAVLAAAAALTAVAAAAVASGCAGGSAFGPLGAPSNCVASLAPAGTEIVGVNLTNPNQAACDDPSYQMVKGYFAGGAVTSSQVVSVMHSSTDLIQFANLDVQPHTAASLGTWTGSYPPGGPDPAATASPALTDISAAGFTTGNINAGASSLKYVAGVPGVYVIACAYHYLSDGMRTVVIVM